MMQDAFTNWGVHIVSQSVSQGPRQLFACAFICIANTTLVFIYNHARNGRVQVSGSRILGRKQWMHRGSRKRGHGELEFAEVFLEFEALLI